MVKFIAAPAFLFFALILGVSHADVVAAEENAEGPIKVKLTETTVEFPVGLRFRVVAESDSPITDVAVRLRSPARSRGVYENLNHRVGKTVDARLLWRAGFGNGYIPSGALLQVSFEIKDAAGNFHETGFRDFVYRDPRFDWIEIASGPVTVAYHGPVKRRAEDVLETLVLTLETMAPILGTDPSVPIRATLYNNYGEMLVALPPSIRQVGHELIAEGQAFSEFNTILILGSGSYALGTAGHEATHILTHQAGDSFVSFLPAWLDEGLAEFGNPQPGFSYDIALEFAIETDRLLPVLYMQFLPANSEDVIIFYGQAKSMVSHMIYTYGPAKIRQLLSELKSGKPMDEALTSTYGFGLEGLDNSWRRAVGASEYVAPEIEASRPTPLPLPALDMYTLDTTPVPPSTDTSVEESTPVAPVADMSIDETTPVDALETDVGEKWPESTMADSGGCNPGASGAAGMMDISGAMFAAWLLVMVALRIRRQTLC